jgi:hypothetical protein
MINYYGIGSWWKSRPHQHFDEFIDNRIACIHASLDKPTNREIANRQRFQDVFRGIKEGDIVYLKSFIIRRNEVRIRAVGKVIPKSKDCQRNNDIFCINVDYNKNHKIEGIVDFLNIEDGVSRDERIYQETNHKIIKIINELMEK